MLVKNPLAHIGSALLLILSLLLTGCATPSPTATVAPTPNTVTLTWSFWGDSGEQEINRKIIAQFEKTYPNIKIKTLSDSWSNYFKRLETEWTGANSPDVMFLEYIPTYASTGMLEDLTPFINAERNFRLDDFYPNLLDMFRYKGGLYGLPRDNDAKVIYVNLKLLKEAGVELPKGGWTWQDLREASRKLTKRDANGNTTQYGFAFELDDWWRLWVWQNGGDIFDTYTPPDPPSRLVLNSPDSIEAIQFLSDLINKDKVSPSYDEMNTSEKISKLFRENKVAMAFGNHSLIPEFGVAPDLAWDVIPLPQSKKRVNALGGAGYVVHKNSKHKPEAWLLIKFLSDLGQVLFMDSGLIFPARQSIREDNIFLRTVKYNWQIFVEETKNGRQNPLFRSSNKIIGEIDKELLPVWKGQKSPAEVLAGLDKKIEPMLLELRK